MGPVDEGIDGYSLWVLARVPSRRNDAPDMPSSCWKHTPCPKQVEDVMGVNDPFESVLGGKGNFLL